jgi:GNAT superfamily N-acetyltransferase
MPAAGRTVPESDVTRPGGLELRSFTAVAIDDAAALLAARHRAQRLREPGLSAAFEEVGACRLEIEALAGRDDASGSVALRDGVVAGYLIGTPRPDSWGPNMWVEAAGHAVAAGESDLVRDLYGFAAAGWVEDGRTSHSAVVPATDPGLVDAWFRVGFGQQHVHAIREVPAADATVTLGEGVTIRRADRDDIPALAALELALPEYQGGSPVFSRMATPSFESAIAEWVEDFDDPRFQVFSAERDGRVIGHAVGCAIEESSEHTGLTRPPDAGFLGFAAVFSDARGLGAGRALGEAVLIWARDSGYATVVTDWRATNLLSSRAWPRLGFRPTFLRLHRAIA